MRVLVVEDARALADVLVEGLRDQGMAVDAAHDGLEAAAKLDVNPYDVVVLDRDLPGISGDTLCQMITERDHRVMVLMLTAAGSPGERVSGLGLGADDYLAKPFHFPELVLRIRALARRQPSARADYGRLSCGESSSASCRIISSLNACCSAAVLAAASLIREAAALLATVSPTQDSLACVISDPPVRPVRETPRPNFIQRRRPRQATGLMRGFVRPEAAAAAKLHAVFRR